MRDEHILQHIINLINENHRRTMEAIDLLSDKMSKGFKTYLFIGDENDAQTKFWGIECDCYYNVKYENSRNIALVMIDENIIRIPYGSEKAFLKNWKLV